MSSRQHKAIAIHYVVFDENWIRLMNMGRGFNKETHKHITIGMGGSSQIVQVKVVLQVLTCVH